MDKAGTGMDTFSAALVPSRREMQIERIKRAVAEACEVTPQMLPRQYGRRSKRACLARFLVAYLVRKLTDYSLPQIGALLGYADHTTVLYATRKIETQIQTNAEDAAFVRSIIRKINADRKLAQKLAHFQTARVTPATAVA